MVRRHFKDKRARALVVKVVGGCEMEGVADSASAQNGAVAKAAWSDVEKVWNFLWREERILLNLMREGKTASDITEILRWPVPQKAKHKKNNPQALEEMKRVICVVRFFVKWRGLLIKLKAKNETKYSDKYIRVARLYAYHRMEYTKIAEKVGYSPNTVQSVLRQIAIGNSQFAEMIKECLSNRMLTNRNYQNKRGAAMSDPWRLEFKKILLERVGNVWYEWGGQLPFSGVADCSGLVIAMLKEIGILPLGFRDMTAQGLAKYFNTTVKNPKSGDLAFYGKDSKHITHVMFFVGAISFNNALISQMMIWPDAVAGMTGGRKNMDRHWAQAVGAGLWIKSSAKYRRDFLFFRRVK